MANTCFVEMTLRGELENINKLIDALEQKDNVYIGRGMSSIDRNEINERTVRISGECKWSMISALFDNARSMKEQKETGNGYWYFPEGIQNIEFLTLFDACKKYHVNIEAYSEEYGMCFHEHFVYENGKEIADCVEAYEYSIENLIDEYQTKEEAEEALGTKIPDYKWEDPDEWVCSGGYSSWEYSISDPDGINIDEDNDINGLGD